jgi:hypothetical protein
MSKPKKTKIGNFKSHVIELNPDDTDGKTVLKVNAKNVDMTIAIGVDAAINFEEAKVYFL